MNNEMSNVLGQSQSGVLTRNLMRNVYVWMSLGLAITGFVALGVSQNQLILSTLTRSPTTLMIVVIAELALVFFLSARIMRISPMTATLIFATYAVLNGVTLSVILLAYTGESVASTFFITAGMFAATSVFAFVTKTDLSSWGNYLRMALIGVIIASVVNFFLRSPVFNYIISYIGVALFVGLTAYDTQHIKRMSDNLSAELDEPNYIRLSIIGALKLYLDFINMFLFLLRIFGNRR